MKALTAACIVALLAPATTAHAQLADASAEDVKQLVVVVVGKLGERDISGAGIVIGTGQDRLYIATANHVVREGVQIATGLKVRLWGLPGEGVDAELLEDLDRTLDLTVLSVRNLASLGIDVGALPFDRLGDVDSLKRAAAVYSVGHPRGNLWRLGVTPERVSQVTSEAILFESYVIYSGHSGGPLVDDQGRLVGMIRKDVQPDGEAVRFNRIIDKLREWRYPVALKTAPTEAPIPSPPPRAADASTAPPKTGVYIPKLNATVRNVLLYASAKGTVLIASRSYSTMFANRGIPYLNYELNLDHSSLPQRVDFRIDATWYRPDGQEDGRSFFDSYIEPGWTSSYHGDRWGRDQGGYFEPGVNRLVLSIDGQIVANVSFTVFEGDAAPSMYVQAVDGKVGSMRFFNGPQDIVPFGKRTYQDRFSRFEARFVSWELYLEYPRRESKTDFNIRSVWTNEAGVALYEQSLEAYGEAGWENSYHAAGYGWSETGNWNPGVYRVDLYVDYFKVAQGFFTIAP